MDEEFKNLVIVRFVIIQTSYVKFVIIQFIKLIGCLLYKKASDRRYKGLIFCLYPPFLIKCSQVIFRIQLITYLMHLLILKKSWFSLIIMSFSKAMSFRLILSSVLMLLSLENPLSYSAECKGMQERVSAIFTIFSIPC